MTLALGGDCLADIAMLRCEPRRTPPETANIRPMAMATQITTASTRIQAWHPADQPAAITTTQKGHTRRTVEPARRHSSRACGLTTTRPHGTAATSGHQIKITKDAS